MSAGTAGVDEAGRGPLAGPVVAAAVVLGGGFDRRGLADSKRLSPRRREALATRIRRQAAGWGLGIASAAEVDELNVLQASLLAMRRSVEALAVVPERVIVDGLHAPRLACPVETLVAADGLVPEVSAASILAKVARDRMMCALDRRWPHYGFARHKGYPTAEHVAALRRLGPCPEHRRSFAPVREALLALRSRS